MEVPSSTCFCGLTVLWSLEAFKLPVGAVALTAPFQTGFSERVACIFLISALDYGLRVLALHMFTRCLASL